MSQLDDDAEDYAIDHVMRRVRLVIDGTVDIDDFPARAFEEDDGDGDQDFVSDVPEEFPGGF